MTSLKATIFFADILDMDYSLYNTVPNAPIYVRTSSLTDREAECIMSQPEIDTAQYKKPIAMSTATNTGFCQPNIHYVINNPDFLKDIATALEQVELFNPANQKWDENKTYTDFNKGDLHISKPCVTHGEKAFVFAQVRRLKPFYYFYCDKWINEMQSKKVNLATDGGTLSTRPCSKRILDPLNRFQTWDTNPQTAFRNRNVTADETENKKLTRPFILADPEIVSPYSLVFTFDGSDFDTVTVIPNGVSPHRGSCISSKHCGGHEDCAEPGNIICFGGLVNGKVSNVALALNDGIWEASTGTSTLVSEMALPIPLIDHTVIEVGKQFYLFGGKTLLDHFKLNSQNDILTRGRKFMEYGYRKDIPRNAANDDEFIDKNTPIKSFHKISGEQNYPPIFGDPEDYEYYGTKQRDVKKLGSAYTDFTENLHVFVFTGVAKIGGTGWQITKRPIQTRKWPISSIIYKRHYAYIFTPGVDSGPVSRYVGSGLNLEIDAAKAKDSGRRRRSLDFVKEMQYGKYSVNTGPFLNPHESQLLYDKNNDETFLPDDWTTVMAQFFADDYHSGQKCKMCDGPSRSMSFQKLRRGIKTDFQDVDIPDWKNLNPGIKMESWNEISLVIEIPHKHLPNRTTS